MADFEIKPNSKLEELAKDLIVQIQANKKPFDTYTIIVPNMMVEQWLKAYWLRNTNEVLMNVKFDRMRPFIYEAYGLTEEDDIFNEDNLRALIVAYLIKDNHYKELSDTYLGKSVKSYIEKDGEVDPINLYEFATKMANLYIKYDINKTELDATGDCSWEKPFLDEIIKEYGNHFLSEICKTIKVKNKKVFLFGFQSIEPLYERFIDQINGYDGNEIIVYQQILDKEHPKKCIKICEAASEERELDFVHSEICKLLLEDKDNSFRFCDVLVVAPDLSKYESCIKKVFTQDSVKYPNIPYVMCNSNEEETSISEALRVIYRYIARGYLTRKDLYDLLSNPLIQHTRGINDDSLDIIMNALGEMNVYRNNERNNEWDYANERLLLSKLLGKNIGLNNKIVLGKGEEHETFVPFNNLELTDKIIAIFADVVEDIDDLLKLKQDEYDSDTLSDLRVKLNKWFIKDNDEELVKSHFYKKVLDEIDLLIQVCNDNSIKIPIDIVFNILLDQCTARFGMQAGAFISGVTFMNYDIRTVLSAKYIFILGLNSKKLPRKITQSELDFVKKDSLEDDRCAFDLYHQNSENIYYSYTYKNVKTGEDYYKSSLISDISFTADQIIKLGIDEKRDDDEIFTRQAFRKKDYYSNLIKAGSKPSTGVKISGDIDKPKIIKVKDIKNFLEDNLQFKANRLFKIRDDSCDIFEEYEPVLPNNIIASEIKKFIIKSLFENNGTLSSSLIEELKEKCRLNHKTNFDWQSVIEDDYFNMTKNICNEGYYKSTINTFGDEYTINSGQKTPISGMNDGKQIEFEIDFNDEYILYNKDNCLKFGEITIHHNRSASDEKAKNSFFLMPYIYSLLYLAKYGDDREYQITIFYGEYKNYGEYLPIKHKTFTMTAKDAKTILFNIYFIMFDYTFDKTKFAILDDVESKYCDPSSIDKSYYDWINKTVFGGWKYYDDGPMFDKHKDLGFTKEGFKNELSSIVNTIKKLVVFLD